MRKYRFSCHQFQQQKYSQFNPQCLGKNYEIGTQQKLQGTIFGSDSSGNEKFSISKAMETRQTES